MTRCCVFYLCFPEGAAGFAFKLCQQLRRNGAHFVFLGLVHQAPITGQIGDLTRDLKFYSQPSSLE